MRSGFCFLAGLFLCFALTGSLEAIDIDLNVQEIGHVPQSSIGGLADVWGWYDAGSGKQYALACNAANSGGVILIETTNPTQPQVIDTLFDAGDRETVDVMVSGNYAFVANHLVLPGEVWIYHLPSAVAYPNDPPAKVLVLRDEISHGDTIPIRTCHELFVTDDYLFLAEGWKDFDGIRETAVFKISNGASPAQPELLAVWNQNDFDTGVYTYPHNFYVKGDTAFIFAFGSGVYGVVFDGNTGGINSWKKIWYDGFRGDVANVTPYDSIYCGGATRARRPFSHSGWLSDDGQSMFVADEGLGYIVPDCDSAQAPCLRVFDVADFWNVSDPQRDTLVTPINAFDIVWDAGNLVDKYYIGASAIDQAASYSTPCPTDDCLDAIPPSYISLGIHNPLIRGRLAFMAWYARGLQVLDITDISDIKHAGYFDHGTGLDGNWYSEAYGVYPFSPDGYIYVSGGQGLYIYRYGITGLTNQDTTLSGDVYIYDTLTVATSHRLEIAAGTNVYMFKDALLKVNGKLVVNGTASNSVNFIVLGGNPQPGDWQGIYVEQNAACTLSYASITKADIGLEMRNNSTAYIANSTISDNSLTGVYNYKGLLEIVDSDVDNNLLYGIDALYAGNVIDNCRLIGNGKYGIRVSGTTASSDSTIVNACKITDPPMGSAYGISVSNNDYVRIEACEIRKYDQGGIYLLKSDPIIKNTSVKVNSIYGIYAFDASDPRIRKCNIDSLQIGVKAAKSSLPNIGIVSMPLADSGLCDFKNCSQYYIYSDWGLNPPTLFAEANYFGTLGPIPSKFYGTIDYTPWITYDPFPKFEIEWQEPLSFRLNSNYPNPFNPRTLISFVIEEPSHAIVEIHNLLGQKIVTIVDRYLPAGEHMFEWDGKDFRGVPVASGIYFYTIQTDDNFESKKMTLVR